MSYIRRGAMQMAKVPPLAFRSSNTTNNAASVNKPAGVAAGDLVVILAFITTGETLTTNTGSAWSRNELTIGGNPVAIFWKALNSTDASNAWNFSVGSVYCLACAYSNGGQAVGSVTVRSTTVNGSAHQSSLSLANFAFSGGRPRMVVSALFDNDNDTTPVQPTGFAMDGTHSFSSGKFRIASFGAGYSGGAQVWTGLNGASGLTEGGWLVDVQ